MSSRRHKVLITGASRGIGRVVANLFLGKGYDVMVPPREELDLADTVSVDNFVNEHSMDLFDVLINNAGINPVFSIDNLPDDQLVKVIQINLVAPIRLTKMVFPGMKSIGYGRIVNVSSIWSRMGKLGRSSYGATKAGITGFSRHIALEGASYNILVNSVAPGFVNTEMTKQNNTVDEIVSIAKKIPVKRLAEPDEVAKLVWYLASEENTYITGQEIYIDGGYTIR